MAAAGGCFLKPDQVAAPDRCSPLGVRITDDVRRVTFCADPTLRSRREGPFTRTSRPVVGGAIVTWQVHRLLDRVPREVLLICGNARRDGVGSADPLKFRCDLTVIEIGIVTTIAADDLERIGVAAFHMTSNDAGWPAPQYHRPVKPRAAESRHGCPFVAASLQTAANAPVRWPPGAGVTGPGAAGGLDGAGLGGAGRHQGGVHRDQAIEERRAIRTSGPLALPAALPWLAGLRRQVVDVSKGRPWRL